MIYSYCHAGKLTVFGNIFHKICFLNKKETFRVFFPDITENSGNEEVQEFVHSFIPADIFQRKPAAPSLEKQQKIPYFLKQDATKPKRPTRFV